MFCIHTQYSQWDNGVYPDVADDDDHEGQEEDLTVDQGVVHAVPRVGRHPKHCQLRHAGPVLQSAVSFLR